MDYAAGCRGPSSVAGAPCNPEAALFNAAPFLSYANALQRSRNRTVLVSLGVAIEEHAGQTPDRFRSSDELETFLNQSARFLAQFAGSAASPAGRDPFHRFAVFQNHAYENMTNATVCTVPALCGDRVPRALWSYSSDLFQDSATAHSRVACVNQTSEKLFLCPHVASILP